MKATKLLHDLGQSLWLDNITRDLLQSGTLAALHRRALGDRAHVESDDLRPRHHKSSTAYDAAIREKLARGQVGRGAVLRAGARGPHPGRRSVPADLGPHRRRRRVGVARGVAAPRLRHARARSPRRRICSPGRDGRTSSSRSPAPRRACPPSRRRSSPACRSTSRSSSRATTTWLPPRRSCAASSGGSRPGSSPRSDRLHRCSSAAGTRAVASKVPEPLTNQLGIAIAKRTYKAYRALLGSPRWQRIYNAGARPQRLLWASTGTKDPKRLRHPVHQGARRAVHREHHARGHAEGARRSRRARRRSLPTDGGDCEEVLARFAKAGIDVDALGVQLQEEGAKAFVKSWNELLAGIESKSAAIKKAG